MRTAGKPDWLKLYQSEALPRLSVESVFGPLPGKRIAGDKLRAPCPLHGGKNRSFAVDLKTLRWYCHSKCGAGGGPIEFLRSEQGGSGPARGREFLELVKELCERAGVGSGSPRAPEAKIGREPVMQSLPNAPHRLDIAEVEATWKLARAVTSDSAVTRWLADERGLAPDLIARSDLARVLMRHADLPRWAGFEKDGHWRSWPSLGYRIVIPLFDSRGHMRSLRFRAPRPGAKARPASGTSGVGLVMADAVARTVLASGKVPAFWESDTFSIVVAEGEPDFWSWATEPARQGLGQSTTTFPCTIGVVGGSFTHDIAARLPVGSHVISAIHCDDGGDRIHARLEAVLEGARRGFTLSRWIAP